MTEQIDLFSYMSQEPAEVHAAAERDQDKPIEPAPLNGMYYERSTGLFVSFVWGRRYWQGDCKGCDAEWQKRTKTQRAI